MYFPILKAESTVQVNDRVRISALESFGTPDEAEVYKVEIKPLAAGAFIDITSVENLYLDWSYAAAADNVVTLKVTTRTDDLVPVDNEYTTTMTISSVTAATDNLFSTDIQIRTLEPDILNWIPSGYSSWNHIHRQAQTNILDWLNEIRITKPDGTAFTKADIVNKDQVRRLSSYIALRMIFYSLSNQVDDIYDKKAKQYLIFENEAKNRNYISLDTDGDSTISTSENFDLRTVRMVRR